MYNNIKYCINFSKEIWRVLKIWSQSYPGFYLPQFAQQKAVIKSFLYCLQTIQSKIKDVLMTKWVNSKVTPPQISKKIDQKINRQGSEFIYGILLNEKDEILIVAALFLQYKLTRGLSQIYHLQIEYKSCNEAQELYFQSRIVHLLPGYKITGLNVTKSQYFPPHQVYMETEFGKTKKVIGSL